jgi:hypothetical protein
VGETVYLHQCPVSGGAVVDTFAVVVTDSEHRRKPQATDEESGKIPLPEEREAEGIEGKEEEEDEVEAFAEDENGAIDSAEFVERDVRVGPGQVVGSVADGIRNTQQRVDSRAVDVLVLQIGPIGKARVHAHEWVLTLRVVVVLHVVAEHVMANVVLMGKKVRQFLQNEERERERERANLMSPHQP